MFATVNGTDRRSRMYVVCVCVYAVGMSDDCFVATCVLVGKIIWKQQQKYEGKAKEQTMAEINVCFVYNYGVNFQCVVLLPGLRICLKRKNAMRLWIIRREFYACTNALCGYVLEFITIVKVLFQRTSLIDIGIHLNASHFIN